MSLPEDLYREIMAYLWDDIPSLRACSLASRLITEAAQNLLFSTVAVRSERSPLQAEDGNGLSGSSACFERLLAHHPHIASHIRSIHIIDRISFQYDGGDGVLVSVMEEWDDGKHVNLATSNPDTYTHACATRATQIITPVFAVTGFQLMSSCLIGHQDSAIYRVSAYPTMAAGIFSRPESLGA